jgi:beta-glucosidase/6-phospho-beta-glucosidase/beta-galactosidase
LHGFIALQTAYIVSTYDHYGSQKPQIDWINSVTENGFAVKGENDMPLEVALVDNQRVHYFQGTTASLIQAIHDDGVDVQSYFPWSTVHP